MTLMIRSIGPTTDLGITPKMRVARMAATMGVRCERETGTLHLFAKSLANRAAPSNPAR